MLQIDSQLDWLKTIGVVQFPSKLENLISFMSNYFSKSVKNDK